MTDKFKPTFDEIIFILNNTNNGKRLTDYQQHILKKAISEPFLTVDENIEFGTMYLSLYHEKSRPFLDMMDEKEKQNETSS